MKKYFFLLLLMNISFIVSAQHKIYDLMDRTDITISETKTIADRYFDSVGTGRGTGYKQFQRWLYERKFHTDDNGYFISPQTEWNNFLQSRNFLNALNRTEAGNWTELGPVTWNRTSSWNPGTGRISAMAIHPANESIIYVGSPGGGLWKSTNAGSNWTPLTDNNSLWMSIFSITIDPLDQNTIYVGTNGGILLKSTNAGSTFTPTGAGPSGTIRKILIHPTATNIVFACSSSGIHRSTNGGASWTLVLSGSKEDIEFKPDDLNIMYASGSDVVRSSNNGVTWTTVGAAQGITNSGRTLVAVSPANPNYVYAVQASGSLFGRMYKSTDAGLTFTTTVVGNPASGTNYFGYNTDGTGTTGQATYDMAMDVSPTNASEVYIAGIICWKSINEGSNFTALTAWSLPNSIGYNHADVHGLFWINSTIYSISDGGIFKSLDAGDNWTDISAGLGIRQFYRIANSPTNANVITGGAQDNGSATRQATGNWVDWLGADGMEGLVSPTNHLKLWGTSQNGSIYRSVNGGNSYSGLPKPSNGQWVTPLVIHPTNEDIIYGGWTGVYKSINGGSNWTNISSGVISTTLADLAVAPSDPNYIYASNGSALYVTTDDGATWSTRSAPATINDITVDPTNPSKIWIACNSASNRVFVSSNAGLSFTNISANLPSITARTITTDDNTPRGIYVGMNIGVYYQQEGAGTWTNFSDNLPLVGINELEIQKTAGVIRVATYGRGVWESPLATPAPPQGFDFTTPAPVSANCPAPAMMSITLGTTSTGGFTNPIILSATAGVPTGTTISFGTNPVTPGNTSVVTLNNANTLIAGSYSVTITGTATGTAPKTRDLTFIINAGTGPAITAHPSNQTICSGTNTSFSITSAATTFQWQVSTDGGATYSIISNGGIYNGANSNTLTLTGATIALNNNRYRCVASTFCGITNSNHALLSINEAPVITAHPQNITLCPGSNQTLCITAIGTNISYQWQSSPSCSGSWTDISGATSSCLSITNISSTTVYRCAVSNICGTNILSNCATITVISPIIVTAQPANSEVCSGSNSTFTVSGTSSQTIIYQWQQSVDGGASWNNINGANTPTLSLNAVTTGMNGNRYRCQLTNAICTTPVTSGIGILTVRQLPAVGLSAAPLTILLPGQTTLLTAIPSLSTGGTLTTSWFKNNIAFANSGNTYSVNIENIGSYQAKIQEAFSSGLTCYNQSVIVSIDAEESSKLFIFPSPNDGQFKLTYYNSNGASTSRSVTVFDSKGGTIYVATFEINGPYTLLNIDIKPAQRGLYFVVIGDATGKKLAEGKVVVH